jgi:putative adenylate-forming enzyme
MAPRMPTAIPDPLRCALTQWSVAALATQTLWTRALGAAAITAARKQRLEVLLQYARAHSPFYRDWWRGVPASSPQLGDLPVVTKPALMAAFDTWSTDPGIRWQDVAAFIGARVHIGERFRDRYLVWTSTGTTGTPGVFVQDDAALAAYDALVTVQLLASAFVAGDWQAAAAQRGRAALITADGDHFAGIASWRRVARGKPWLDMQSFAVTRPLPDLVAALNAYRPAFVSSYPTMLALLADEQQAGRLQLQPAGLCAGGEVLTRSAQAAIEAAFGCPLLNEYGASECLTIAHGCREGVLHVNADWVILEPVDGDYQPTPPGELSHTVLLTNLANLVQPIIRYDLGDRVRVRAEACACGSTLPAIEVEGRCDDVVTFPGRDGTVVRIVPLALSTVVEEAADVHWFQIVQHAPDRLQLRLAATDRRRAGAATVRALRELLDANALHHVRVQLVADAPQCDPRDGKLRQVIALRDVPPGATPAAPSAPRSRPRGSSASRPSR